MTEATLVKRILFVSMIVIVAFSAVACTRDKPADTPVVAQIVTPAAAATTPASTAVTPAAPVVTATIAVPVPPVTQTVPPPPPIPTVTPTPPTSAPSTYTVQLGDTLTKIGGQFGVTPQAIINANPGINPNLLSTGQVLKIPAAASTNPSDYPTALPPSGGTPLPTDSGTGVLPNPGTYTVQRGDWLYAIARKFGVSVQALMAANPGINPNYVFPGQVLNIPGGGANPPAPATVPSPSGNTYTVQAGDTLFSIAVRFHTTIYALQIANHLSNTNAIYPGQVLIIPQQ